MTTPIVVTFDQSYKDDEDEEMQDVTILEESKLGDVGPRQGSPAGSRTPWARNEISSQTPWVENGIVSDQEGSELAIGGSRLLNFTARENNEQLNGYIKIASSFH